MKSQSVGGWRGNQTRSPVGDFPSLEGHHYKAQTSSGHEKKRLCSWESSLHEKLERESPSNKQRRESTGGLGNKTALVPTASDTACLSEPLTMFRKPKGPRKWPASILPVSSNENGEATSASAQQSHMLDSDNHHW